MSGPAPNADTSNPFPGLRSYTKSSAWKLFGRDADASLMITRVLSGRTTLLFAGTGVGKTSFLDAKLTPDCESRFAIVPHRTWAGDTPLALLKKSIRESLNGKEQLAGEVPQLLAQVADLQKRPVLLILDQFEEIFQHHRDTEAIRDFKKMLVNLINDTSQDLRLILAMREEFLGELSMFENSIPDPFYNYYHLKNLSDRQAAGVIEATASTVKTAAGKPVECDFEKLNDLIQDLRKIPSERKGEALSREFVPPPYLQIVCQRLWSRTKPDETDLPFLSEYVNGTAISEFHAYCNEKLEMPEDEKEVAAEAFGFLMSRSGAKMAYELGDLARLMRVNLALLASALGRLSDPEVRILRSFLDPENKPWFELYHDMYAPFLMSWKAEQDATRRRKAEELARQAVERQKQLEQRQEELRKERELKTAQEEELRKRKREVFSTRFATIALTLIVLIFLYGVNPWREAHSMKQATAELSDRSAQPPTISSEKVKQSYENLQRDSWLLGLIGPSFRPKNLWARYWGARADAEAREENRDPALLFDMKVLAEVPSNGDATRTWRAKMLMGGSYTRLLHSYPIENTHISSPGRGPLATITPDGILVTVYEDGTIRRWNTATGNALPSVFLQAEKAETPDQGQSTEQSRSGGGNLGRILGLSPQGDYVAALLGEITPSTSRSARPGADGHKAQPMAQIAVFSLKSGKQMYRPLRLTWANPNPTFQISPLSFLRAIFSPDGSMLAVLSLSDIRLCSVAAQSGRDDSACSIIRLPEEKLFIIPFSAVAFSPDGKQLAVATREQITLWSANKESPSKLLQTRHYRPGTVEPRAVDFTDAPSHVNFLDNGFMAASVAGSLRVWDPNGNVTQAFELPSMVQQMAFSRIDKAIIVAATNGKFYACYIATGRLEAVGTLDSAPRLVSFAPDAASFLSFQADYGFRQWTVRTVLDSPDPGQFQYPGSSGTISPDARHVAIVANALHMSGFGGRRNSGQQVSSAELTVYSVADHSSVVKTSDVLDDESVQGEPFAFFDNQSILVDEVTTFRHFTFDERDPQVIPKNRAEAIITNRSGTYVKDGSRSTCRVWDTKNAEFRPELVQCKFLVFRSNGDIAVFHPATGLTIRHWDGSAWQQTETIRLPNGDDISALIFGPGTDMLTVAEGRWIIIYRLDANKNAIRVATWKNKNPGSTSMFQLKDGGDVFLLGQSWLHRISRVDEDAIASIDLPDTEISSGAWFSIDGNKIKVLRKFGEKLALQELDLSTPANPEKDNTDWATQFRVWQQKLGYNLADDGTLVPQGTKASAK